MEGCGDGDMKNHIVHVDDRQVTVDQKFVVANNKNVDTVELVLDGEWNCMDQIVVSFTNSNGMAQSGRSSVRLSICPVMCSVPILSQSRPLKLKACLASI